MYNHLPFDLSLSLTVGSAVSGRGLPGPVAKGRGSETLLWELTADTWYYLRFRERLATPPIKYQCKLNITNLLFCPVSSEHVPVSEPPVPVSTFLLLQLPFSAVGEEREGKGEWPYLMPNTESPPPHTRSMSTMAVTLPMEGGHYLSLSVALLRSRRNTISLLLEPPVLLVNSCPLTVRVLEGSPGEEGAGQRSITLESTGVGTILGSEVSCSLVICDRI